ncbi:anti-sigma-K factor RskA [Dokdonella fugitiva]|uniref:Anti-sigma-K factor RskA n=1 Tax=Dokdonella fugitiva TaxID=328517 RepID=A0A839F9N8_9GAMM|nr:anti-sigma factor [Dokdonella fugitiva]MBA8889790.1 anti-sigma-K factor RskA [Dokdonella fugitiva]
MNSPVGDFDDGGHSHGDDMRAGEYVLGVLDGFERRRVQRRIDVEPAFARLVAEWERRLAAWTLHAAAVEPPAHVWPGVRARLGWSADALGRVRAWNSVGFWRGAAVVALAAGIAAFIVGRIGTPPAGVAPTSGPAALGPVTVLAADDGSTGWLASIDVAKGTMLVVPVPRPVATDGRVPELWLIPPGQAPRSLGFVSNEKPLVISVPPTLLRQVAVGATLAISLELPSAMPHAAPSGAIVAKGGIRTI